jgi:hypothetical protein
VTFSPALPIAPFEPVFRERDLVARVELLRDDELRPRVLVLLPRALLPRALLRELRPREFPPLERPVDLLVLVLRLVVDRVV